MAKDTNRCDGCGKDFTEVLQALEAWDAHPLDPCGLCEDCCTHNHGPLYVRRTRGSVELHCDGCRTATDQKIQPEHWHLYEGACAGGCGSFHYGTIGWVDSPSEDELRASIEDLQRHLGRARKLRIDVTVEPLTREELLAKIRKPARDRKGV